jgi:hypothetical protein
MFSPGLNPVASKVKAAPTGPCGGVTLTVAVGKVELVGGRELVVDRDDEVDEPPDQMAAPMPMPAPTIATPNTTVPPMSLQRTKAVNRESSPSSSGVGHPSGRSDGLRVQTALPKAGPATWS